MSPLGKRRVVTAGDATTVLLVDLCGNLKGETGRQREREKQQSVADGVTLPEILLFPLVMPRQLWCPAALHEHRSTQDTV